MIINLGFIPDPHIAQVGSGMEEGEMRERDHLLITFMIICFNDDDDDADDDDDLGQCCSSGRH